MDLAPLATLRSALLAQIEELIGLGEQNRTCLLALIDRRTAAGQPTAEVNELLSLVEEYLAGLHAWRQRLLP